MAGGLIGISAGDEEAAAGDVRTSALFIANVAYETSDLAGVRQCVGGWIGEWRSGARTCGSDAERVKFEQIDSGNGTEDECSIARFGGQVKKGATSRVFAAAAANFG
jgi:hypothetical protein